MTICKGIKSCFSPTLHRHIMLFIQIREFLSERFPAQWIVRSSAIIWPARPTDLNPLAFSLESSEIKRLHHSAENIRNLKQRIITECRRTTPEVLRWCFRRKKTQKQSS